MSKRESISQKTCLLLERYKKGICNGGMSIFIPD